MTTAHSIEISLMLLALFVVGCLVGFWARRYGMPMLGFAVKPAANIAKAAAEPQPAAPVKAPAPARAEIKPAIMDTSGMVAANDGPKVSPKAKMTSAAAEKPAAAKTKPAKTKATKATQAKAKQAAKKLAPAASEAPAGMEGTRPQGLASPRAGASDDLKTIKGVGPKIETTLNGLGIFHFDQIAGWGAPEVAWVNGYLSFKGRIEREEWVRQAKAKISAGS